MPHEQTIPTTATITVLPVAGAPATHYPGCYRDPGHHACALAEIARLKALAAQETENAPLENNTDLW
jgi:hypothetical protein